MCVHLWMCVLCVNMGEYMCISECRWGNLNLSINISVLWIGVDLQCVYGGNVCISVKVYVGEMNVCDCVSVRTYVYLWMCVCVCVCGWWKFEDIRECECVRVNVCILASVWLGLWTWEMCVHLWMYASTCVKVGEGVYWCVCEGIDTYVDLWMHVCTCIWR